MKQKLSFFLLFFVLFSCGKQIKTDTEKLNQIADSTNFQIPIDTFALTLEALRHKRLPEGYQMLGDVKTAVLKFSGFEMDDLNFYFFKNSSGKVVVFNGNDTNYNLTIPSSQSPTEKILPSEAHHVKLGKFVPNPKYLNKKFRVVWRTIQLIDNPQNEKEYYYQEYDEIIYLKETAKF